MADRAEAPPGAAAAAAAAVCVADTLGVAEQKTGAGFGGAPGLPDEQIQRRTTRPSVSDKEKKERKNE